MNFADFDSLEPIKETGFVGHEECDIESLYEIDGVYYLTHTSHCVFFSDTPETVRQISEEEAIVFLEEPDIEYELNF
jgi:hypothetical protein